jgi:atypical dual specificity phosphatase
MVDCDQILPNLYVGTYPQGFEDIRGLKKRFRVSVVLNLQTDHDIRERGIDWKMLETHYRMLDIEVHRVPMRDFDYDNQKVNLPDAVRVLSKLLASGHVVYLHCNAGTGRSPLVAMAYLHWCRKMSLEEAVSYVKERRASLPNEELLLTRPNADPDSPC